MGLTQSRITVTTTPTLVLASDGDPVQIRIHNTSSAAIYLGGKDVTTSTGFHLEATADFDYTLMNGNSLWAVASSGSHAITVMGQEI